MSAVKYRIWTDQLRCARRERDEIEIKLYFDCCPWWERQELERELSWRLHWIEEAELMLGFRSWVGDFGKRAVSIWGRLCGRLKKHFGGVR